MTCDCTEAQKKTKNTKKGEIKDKHKCKTLRPDYQMLEAILWTYDIETIDTTVRDVYLDDCNLKIVKAIKNIKFIDEYNLEHSIDLESMLNIPNKGYIKSIYFNLEDTNITLIPIDYKKGILTPHNQLLTLIQCKVKRMQKAFAIGVSKGPEKNDYIKFYGFDCIIKFVQYL